MDPKKRYSINLKAKHGFLELIDVPALAAQVTDDWYNQTLCQVNDSVVRLGVFKKGVFHWHKHEKEDEFFFVLQGQFVVEIENQRIILKQHQGYTVPRGTLHRTMAPEPAVILMMEATTVTPTGDA
jgi:mannose-6-phosphate isomerase-like protein (cupin superfamily)